MKIRQKLIIGFIAVSSLVGLVGILGLYANNHVVSTYEGGEEHFGTIVVASNEVSSYAKRAQGHLMQYLTLHNETDRKKFYQRVASLREQNSIIEARVKNPEAIKILSAIKSDTDELQSVGESLLKAHDNETKTTGKFVIENYEDLVRKLDDVAARIRSDGLKLSKVVVDLDVEQQNTAKQNAAFLYNIILIISLAAVTGALVLGYVISKSIANPVMKLREAAVDIGRGNLGAMIEIKSKDEIGELADTFNKMAEELQKSTAERMHAADALKKSKEFNETVLNCMNDAISVIDVSDFRIIDANTVFLESYGLNKEEVIGKTCHEITHKRAGPCNLFDELCPLLDTVNTGEYSITEHIHCVKDGEKRYVEVAISPIKNENGKVISVIHVARDITERKKAEELRLENERLASANRAKSEFLSIMSHELRTPMNAVIGFSELLKQKMAGELNERQEHFVENILASGKRQLSLIEEILDLTLIEAKKLELTIEKMPVPETIEETLDLIKPSTASRNVLVKIELDPKLGFIMADRKRFEQILSNLLDNAVKFSKPEGGTVIVTSKKEGDMAKFSVSDTGIGIKEEDMGKLFKMFQQVDMGTSRKYGGTGIGLAITKQLVELHGGKIMAESKFGEGSTVTFLLPLKPLQKHS